jgi:hypothetical protein
MSENDYFSLHFSKALKCCSLLKMAKLAKRFFVFYRRFYVEYQQNSALLFPYRLHAFGRKILFSHYDFSLSL